MKIRLPYFTQRLNGPPVSGTAARTTSLFIFDCSREFPPAASDHNTSEMSTLDRRLRGALCSAVAILAADMELEARCGVPRSASSAMEGRHIDFESALSGRGPAADERS